jgi:hypothetical protein
MGSSNAGWQCSRSLLRPGYLGPWRLTGPDSHRLAVVSLSLGWFSSYLLSVGDCAPELLAAPGVLDSDHSLPTIAPSFGQRRSTCQDRGTISGSRQDPPAGGF